jgi:flagellar basal body-associated protein FliL
MPSPESKRDPEEKPAEPGELVAPRWRRLLKGHWLAAIVVTSVVAHGLMWAVQTSQRTSGRQVRGEVTLGEFEFHSPPGAVSRVGSASFQLHISLLQEMETRARTRLEGRRFKVQQDVEELLRQAHGGDFDDPQLDELKRQIQEQINQSLDLRAISEVIITDLAVDRRNIEADPATAAAPETGESAQPPSIGTATWEEKPVRSGGAVSTSTDPGA